MHKMCMIKSQCLGERVLREWIILWVLLYMMPEYNSQRVVNYLMVNILISLCPYSVNVLIDVR